MSHDDQLPLIYAIRHDGEVVSGHARTVAFGQTHDSHEWGAIAVQRTAASMMTMDFVEHGETLVDFWAYDMDTIMQELERRERKAREQKERARLMAGT